MTQAVLVAQMQDSMNTGTAKDILGDGLVREDFEHCPEYTKIPLDHDLTLKNAASVSDLSRRDRTFPVALLLSSAFLFSMMHVCVRYTSHTLHLEVPIIAFCRGALQFTMCSLIIIWLRPCSLLSTVSSSAGFMLVARGALGAMAMWCKYEAIARLPVAIAACVFTTTPIFATFLGWMVRGEQLSRNDFVALLLTTAGAVMVGSSGSDSNPAHGQDTRVTGVLLGLCASMLTGVVYVLIRSMGSKVHFILSVYALSVGAMVVPMIPHLMDTRDVEKTAMHFFGVLPRLSREELLGVAGVGVSAFAAAACLNRGVQLMEAGRAALMRTSDIPINFLVGLIFLGEFPRAALQVAGCVLIACSTYIVVADRAK